MLAAAPAQPAAQQGVAYAALPDERAAFEAWYIAQVRSKTSTTNDRSDDEIRGAWLYRPSEEYRSSFAGQSWEAWQARASHGQAPAEPEGISREDWIEQAVRVYLIAGDTDEQAQECAAYLWGELDMDDLADPYDAAMSDIEGRNMPRKETQ
jgi:hypothetical protein